MNSCAGPARRVGHAEHGDHEEQELVNWHCQKTECCDNLRFPQGGHPIAKKDAVKRRGERGEGISRIQGKMRHRPKTKRPSPSAQLARSWGPLHPGLWRPLVVSPLAFKKFGESQIGNLNGTKLAPHTQTVWVWTLSYSFLTIAEFSKRIWTNPEGSRVPEQNWIDH